MFSFKPGEMCALSLKIHFVSMRRMVLSQSPPLAFKVADVSGIIVVVNPSFKLSVGFAHIERSTWEFK